MFSLFPTDFEASFIRLLDKITNGSRIEINQTGKLLFFLFGKASTYALLNHSSFSHSIWWYTFYIQMETSSFLSVIQLFGDMCEFCQFKGHTLDLRKLEDWKFQINKQAPSLFLTVNILYLPLTNLQLSKSIYLSQQNLTTNSRR